MHLGNTKALHRSPLAKSACCQKKVDLTSGLTLHPGYNQSPEFKFRFVFFRLSMLRFSALCGPNEKKFGELLT